MTDDERWEVYNALMQRSNKGVLKRTTTKEVADLLAVPLQLHHPRESCLNRMHVSQID